MAVVYNKLFKLLIDKGITPSQLARQAGVNANIVARMRNGSYIALETVEKICGVLNVGVDDVLEFVNASNKKSTN